MHPDFHTAPHEGGFAIDEMTLAHRPMRPRWMCGGCGAPWPCADVRKELFEETGGDRLYLSIYFGLYHAEAAGDLSSDHLYDRFLGWIHDPSRR